MKLNQSLNIKVRQLAMDGQAYVPIQGETVILNGVLPDEEVKVTLIKRIKEGWIGRVDALIKRSPKRVNSACPYSLKCGGCAYLHMDYAYELQLKKQQLIDLVNSQGLRLKVHDVCGMEAPCAYRNKIIMSFGRHGKQVQFGFYSDYSHEIVDIKNCLNHDEVSNRILQTIKELVIKYRVEIYDEDRRTGFLRHVLIRRGFMSNQTLVCFVGAQKVWPGSKNFVSELIQRCPEVTSVVQNTNSRKTSVVLGDEEKVLYGKGFIIDKLLGVKYTISAKSFYQINHDQTENLYAKAIELMALKGNEMVYDMYCGIGTIGISAASKAKKVIGVEVNRQAVEDAKKNAAVNQIKNVEFVCEDASAYMKKAAAQRRMVDAVFIDPPRSGSDEAFLTALANMKPKQIVYVSCNPQTQMRDIKVLMKYGYQAEECYPFDMFPRTAHIETCVLLSHKNPQTSPPSL